MCCAVHRHVRLMSSTLSAVPSISVLLHELVKLLHYARNRHNPLFMRLGTCGGLGVEPGTVIAARHCVNGRLEVRCAAGGTRGLAKLESRFTFACVQAVHETWVLGKPVRRATTFDAEAIAIAEECAKGVRVDAERRECSVPRLFAVHPNRHAAHRCRPRAQLLQRCRRGRKQVRER